MVETIKITYRNSAYYVDRPNWDGGEVVPADDYATLEAENARLRDAASRALTLLDKAIGDTDPADPDNQLLLAAQALASALGEVA